MKYVVLGLGSNKTYSGLSPVELLAGACHDLSLILKNPVFSSVYRTKAMYVTNQDDFYNMAVTGEVEDDADPFQFLEQIHKIEERFGRNRLEEIRFGPRSLDIDIERFGNDQINHPDLQIPHIRIKERAFVLIPLLEIFSESADVKIREEYTDSLEILRKKGETADIEKVISQKEMLKMISQQAVQNGTKK